MSTLKERASYLAGLAEGMELEASKESKLILKLLEVVDEMAERIDDLEAYVEELDAKVDEIDHDLGDLEEEYYEDCDCDCDDDDCDCCDCDCDDDDVYEFECDKCGETIFVDGSLLDEDEEILCPNCGEEISLEFDDCDCGCCDHE